MKVLMSLRAQPALPDPPWEDAVFLPSKNEWQRARAGVKRKVYPARKGIWVRTPILFDLRDKRRPVQEIAAKVDRRSLDTLRNRATDALNQMLVRAHSGDNQALIEFAATVHLAVGALETLAKHERRRVRTLAEYSDKWPVLLSPHSKEVAHAVERLKSLGLGTKLPPPLRPPPHINPRNFWTWMAARLYATCRQAKRKVPRYLAETKGAFRKERKTERIWRTSGTKIEATFYYLPNAEVIYITDWQKRCVELPADITEANFKEWWATMKLCLLQFWWNRRGKGNYKKALEQIQYADTAKSDGTGGKLQGENVEARQRAHALHQMERAFRSLAGLRVRQKAPATT